MKHILAIDLGATNTKLALISHDLKILHVREIPTNGHLRPDRALQSWLKAVEDWLQTKKISFVGMGSPGPLDSKKGIILETPNLNGWAGFSFLNFFKKNCGLKVFLENDAHCAALGEWTKNRISHQITLTLGTGIGCGVIIDNKLLRGTKGVGGEAGHMVIDRNGPLCACGRNGCVESFIGGRAFVARYLEHSEAEAKTTTLTPKDIFDLARQGESLAQQHVEEWLDVLAVAIGNLINIFNPERVTLTGGVSPALTQYDGEFQKKLLAQAFKPHLKCSEVVVSKLQNKAGLLGAAFWAKQQA